MKSLEKMCERSLTLPLAAGTVIAIARVILPIPVKVEIIKGFSMYQEHYSSVYSNIYKHLITAGTNMRFQFAGMICVLASCSFLAYAVEPDFTGVKLIRNVEYLGAERNEKLDLYLPADDNGPIHPGIIIIHGGGWAGGDKFWPREQITGSTLARCGYVCASINYTLCEPNKPTWPQNIYDCKKAVQFLRKNAIVYKIDTNHIGVIGGSAGGHLAAMLGVANSDVGLEPNDSQYHGIPTRVQAVVDMYGITDLTKWKNQNSCQRYLGYSYQQMPQLYVKASPLTHVSHDDPPFLIIHGTKDTVVELEQSLEFMTKLKSNGVPVELIRVADAPHAFHLQPPQQDLRPIVIHFFDTYLKKNKLQVIPKPSGVR
jgi:acetyl esterase/lipase